jgi:hypothetical protein
MSSIYSFETKAGTFTIVRRAGLFHVILDGESLGSYASAQQAAEDVAGGHTFTPSSGVDTSRLGIPQEISEWEHD